MDSQSSQQEYTHQRNLLHPVYLELPDLVNRQAYNRSIGGNVGNGVADEGCFKVDAFSVLQPWLPCLADRVTLEDADETYSQPPGDGESAKGIGGDPKASCRENAVVHKKETDLDGSNARDVDALER